MPMLVCLEGKPMFVFGILLSFFLPLIVHVWAGLATVIIGIVVFCAPKRWGRHPRWGARYLWAYTLVFLTATMLSFQHWVLPTVIGIPFIVLSLSRFAPRTVTPSSRLRAERNVVKKEEGYDTASFEEETV
jgi:hypothetical protein